MVAALSIESFKKEIFDFTKQKEWNFQGQKPAIIDFYADWCSPCKAIAPVLEELSEEYKGKVDVFKINTETEMELSAMFGIRSIPSLLFIPKQGTPMMHSGAMPYQGFVETIEKELLK